MSKKRNNKSSDNFLIFVVKDEKLNEGEKKHLNTIINNKTISRLINMSYILAVWSIVSVFINIFIVPLVVLIISIQYKNIPLALSIGPIYFIINLCVKYMYIRHKISDIISVKETLMAIIPYVGLAFMLKSWFVKDKVLLYSIKRYIIYRRHELIQKIKTTNFGSK